jgi:Ca2+-binding RTX toxin-like protein
MGLLSMVQSIWTRDLPVLGQVARLDVETGSAGPALVIHDPATGRLARASLGAGFSAGALALPAFRSEAAGGAGDMVTLTIGGRARGIDAATLARLGATDGSATAYLDGIAFAGNSVALHHVRIDGQGWLFAAPGNGSGITAFRTGSGPLTVAGGDTLAVAGSVADTPGLYLSGIVALDSLSLGGRHFLVAASQRENGLGVIEIGATGTLTPRGGPGADRQLPVDRPQALVTAELDGRGYVLMGSFGSGSVSVFELLADGRLVFADQVNDSLSTRFGGLAALDAVSLGGRVLVAAAGNDGGVSLFQLLPGGRLIHRETVIDGTGSALAGITQLRFVSDGGKVELWALATGDGGLTRLALDVAALGPVLHAGAAGGNLRGTAGADILVDGAGSDRMWGGAGADVFVFSPDARPDTVSDFNRFEDRIDLGAFPALTGAAHVAISAVTGGAVMRWDNEELRVLSHDGASLRWPDLAGLLILATDRVAPAPPGPVAGDAGNNRFEWSDGPDTIDGGAGIDCMSYATAPMAAVADLEGAWINDMAAFGDVLRNIESLEGSAFDDRLRGDRGANTLTGFAGNDRLMGGHGNDWLLPGAGNDTVDGEHGSDTVSYAGSAAAVRVDLAAGTAISGGDSDRLISIENVTGSAYADVITGDDGANRIRGLGDYDWMIGSAGADSYDGGNGRDMVSYVYAPGAVTVNLATGRGLAGIAAGDTYVSVERITGSGHADLIYGGSGEEDFRGVGGYDWFIGSTGGKDRYDGGSGLDTVAYWYSATGVVANLALGRGSAGDAARDLYTSIENLTGSSHGDHLTGDNGRNVLRGLYGEDTLIGGGGVDRLEGGASDDYLDGGWGWDYAIYGGNRSAYTVSTAGDVTTVSRIGGGGDGTDTLVNIEAIQFADILIYI